MSYKKAHEKQKQKPTSGEGRLVSFTSLCVTFTCVLHVRVKVPPEYSAYFLPLLVTFGVTGMQKSSAGGDGVMV